MLKRVRICETVWKLDKLKMHFYGCHQKVVFGLVAFSKAGFNISSVHLHSSLTSYAFKYNRSWIDFIWHFDKGSKRPCTFSLAKCLLAVAWPSTSQPAGKLSYHSPLRPFPLYVPLVLRNAPLIFQPNNIFLMNVASKQWLTKVWGRKN